MVRSHTTLVASLGSSPQVSGPDVRLRRGGTVSGTHRTGKEVRDRDHQGPVIWMGLPFRFLPTSGLSPRGLEGGVRLFRVPERGLTPERVSRSG